MQENDITLVDNGTAPIITPADNTPHTEAVQTDAARGFGTKSPIKYAALAGAGIGIGGLTMGFKGTDAEPIVPETADTTNHLAQTNPPTVLPQANLATTVTDKMDFGDAFHAARVEQGAGGVFEWKGQYYNTYYKEEWAGMSLEQKGQYAHSIDHLTPPANYHPLPDAVAEHANATQHTPVADADVTIHTDSVVIQVDSPNEPTITTNATHTEPTIQTVAVEPSIHTEPTINTETPEATVQTESTISTEVADISVPTEPTIPTHIDQPMPDMPNDLVEIPLEEGITGYVHLNADRQPDAIYIDQDGNKIPELVITPDPSNPSNAHYLLDENQDHIIDKEGIMNENMQTADNPHGHEQPTAYDEPTQDNTGLADDFQQDADMGEWA